MENNERSKSLHQALQRFHMIHASNITTVTLSRLTRTIHKALAMQLSWNHTNNDNTWSEAPITLYVAMFMSESARKDSPTNVFLYHGNMSLHRSLHQKSRLVTYNAATFHGNMSQLLVWMQRSVMRGCMATTIYKVLKVMTKLTTTDLRKHGPTLQALASWPVLALTGTLLFQMYLPLWASHTARLALCNWDVPEM